MSFTEENKVWFINQIEKLDPNSEIVKLNLSLNKIIYNSNIRSDETLEREIEPEELVRALAIILLCTQEYGYEIQFFYIEKYYSIGRPSSSRAEIDLIIFEHDELAFSVWEFKSPDEFHDKQDHWIKYQLFDPSPLIGAPKYLVYATILPEGDEPKLKLINIDYQEYSTLENWIDNKRQHYESFPPDYEDENIKPLIKGSAFDLKTNVTHKEFRSLARTFHQKFFGERQDTDLFKDILKLTLAKIYDERTTATNHKYKFQIFHHGRKEESNQDLFQRIQSRYKEAYKRYIEPGIAEDNIPDLSPNEFSPENVKFVVRKLQRFSLTKNTANQGDIVGSFFEEILRDGFKQDKGMYFTHSNLVQFMVEAIDIRNLGISIFKNATHHSNRMPYIIDPACGSGTFLLIAMKKITQAILENKDSLVTDDDSNEFFNHNLSPDQPNHWAKDFIYGFDPKFVMALTSKVNMVLHGDGSAHIYRYDGLASLDQYNDPKLNEMPRSQTTVQNTTYEKPVCERFDGLITNPPFGITIDEDIKRRIPSNFNLPPNSGSEALFFERWFQMLKPNGRLAAVLPESFFNTAENINSRILLYKFFKIKAIVSLPQNLFVDTPTSTSLLFAQKKTKEEIELWEHKWNEYEQKSNETINKIRTFLKVSSYENLEELKKKVLDLLRLLLDINGYIVKKGKAPIKIIPLKEFTGLAELKSYYREILNLSGFKQAILNYIFKNVVNDLNYNFKTYCVDEVGYKLSKRYEKERPNQLCKFLSTDSEKTILNLHLTDDNIEVKIDISSPKTVLDYIRRDVIWD